MQNGCFQSGGQQQLLEDGIGNIATDYYQENENISMRVGID